MSFSTPTLFAHTNTGDSFLPTSGASRATQYDRVWFTSMGAVFASVVSSGCADVHALEKRICDEHDTATSVTLPVVLRELK
mgnify:FL=1